MENILPPFNQNANLENYQETCRTFRWEDVKEEFTWARTGKVNIGYEAIDRHTEDREQGQRYCLTFEGGNRKEKITYDQMKELSNKFANVLRKLGTRKGDRVFLFLPRCPEYYISMVGCAKVGAVFGPLFEALMQVALAERLGGSGATILVTTPRLLNRVPLRDLPDLNHIILVEAGGVMLKANEVSWEDEMALAPAQCDIEWLGLEDPLYLIYTYSPAGQPKGVVHVHNDMIGHLLTARWVLDLRSGDILWTTADPGWITGTVYGAFAPWLCGIETFVRSGTFNIHGWCRSIESNRITVLYAAPTVYRRFIAGEEEILKNHDLSSLRHLLSVGEPLPSEVVYWARRVFKVPVHDTWWMTETGMIVIANYPSLPIKPGSIGKPFPGIRAAVIDPQGEELPPLTLGELAIQSGWPAMMRQIWRDDESHQEYFRDSWFVSGDTAYMDEDGYFYYQGRDDDLLKIAGVVVGPSEIEDILRRHPSVMDAGIIGKPDPLKGNSIKAFISLKPGIAESDELKQHIVEFVKKHFSPRIAPREIEFRPGIPRSKEGLVIRRVLKAWELGLPA